MEYLQAVKNDLCFAQDTWEAEVECRTRSMSTLNASINQEGKLLSELSSDTNKLLDHFNSFAKAYWGSFSSLEERLSQDPILPTQSFETLCKVIDQSSLLQEKMLEDPRLRSAIIQQFKTAYSKTNFHPRTKLKGDEDIELFPSSGYQELWKVFATGLDIKNLYRQLSVVHSVRPAAAHNQVLEGLSSLTSQVIDLECGKHEKEGQDYTKSWQSTGGECTLSDDEDALHSTTTTHCLSYLQQGYDSMSPDDLESRFHRAKKQELAIVLNVIEQSRNDRKAIIRKLEAVHSRLQGRRELHRENLELLNDRIENTIARLTYMLDVMEDKSFAVPDANALLDFGQVYVTEYNGNLWRIVLRFLSSHGPGKDARKGNSKLLEELSHFDDSVAKRFRNCEIHSALMASVCANHSGQHNIVSDPEAPTDGLDLAILQNERLSGMNRDHEEQPMDEAVSIFQPDIIPIARSASSETVHCQPSRQNYRGQDIDTDVTCKLGDTVSDESDLLGRKFMHNVCSLMGELGADYAVVPSCIGDPVLIQTDTVEWSVPRNSPLVVAIIRLGEVAYSWIACVLVCLPVKRLSEVGYSWATYLLGFRTEIIPVLRVRHVVPVLNYFRDKSIVIIRSHLATRLASFLRKHCIVIAFLLAGILGMFKLKMVVDRQIVKVSHSYLSSEFRRMLRHDRERQTLSQYRSP